MTDLTLDDLANGTTDDGSEPETTDDGSDESTAEWANTLVERLDEKGVIDAVIAQQMGVDMNDTNRTPTDSSTDTDTEADVAGLDAGDVAQFGKLVIDNAGDVSMSKVVEYAENQPELVNRLIQQATEE